MVSTLRLLQRIHTMLRGPAPVLEQTAHLFKTCTARACL